MRALFSIIFTSFHIFLGSSRVNVHLRVQIEYTVVNNSLWLSYKRLKLRFSREVLDTQSANGSRTILARRAVPIVAILTTGLACPVTTMRILTGLHSMLYHLCQLVYSAKLRICKCISCATKRELAREYDMIPRLYCTNKYYEAKSTRR